MSKKIKAIVKRPDEEYGHSTWISNSLDNFQRTVEGYIEAVTYGELIGYPGFVIVCNDEGRIRELPYNCEVGGNLFFGTIVVVGVDGEDFGDCPLTFKKWKEILNAQC